MEYVLRQPARFTNEDALVRLADDARKCVAYLGYADVQGEANIEPVGTGFLICHGDPPQIYLVTARHIAEQTLKDDPFVVRLNDKSGSGQNDLIDGADWYYHPSDRNIDVAIMEYDPPDWADYLSFPRRAFLSEDKLKSKDTGAGDLAYVVGVFHPLYGKARNIPVVHTGHIALMEENEAIPIDDWRDPDGKQKITTKGYLVEAGALPGASGSPVFIRRSIELPRTVHGKLRTWTHGTVWLLGLWQGSWHGDPAEYLNLPTRDRITVPAGIGVVVPAVKIIEALDQAVLVTRR